MANRNFQNNLYHMERSVVKLFAEIAIGATGAPTLTFGNGINSVAKTTTGDYLITLDDSYFRLLGMNAKLMDPVGEDITFQLKEEAVKASKTLSILTLTGGAETEPSDGSVIFLELTLKNSSVVR